MNNHKILFVDDDELVCRAVQRSLASRGMIVMTATNGGDAMRHAGVERFDTIIVDVHLSDELGTELVASLASCHPDAVFILATGADAHTIPSSEADGIVTCVLAKPFTADEVIAAVRRERPEGHPEDIDRPLSALIVADETDGSRVEALLATGSPRLSPLRVTTLAEAAAIVATTPIDVCLASPGLRDSRGIAALHGLRELLPTSAIVVLAPDFDDARVARFLRHGADDVMTFDSLAAGDGTRIIRLACDRRLARRDLIDRAQRDPLTGLVTKPALRARFQRGRELAERFDSKIGLVFIDLDGFKQVNDTLGHAAGDALLQEISRRLCAHLRCFDTVARIGGDEFVFLAEQVKTRADLDSIVDRLRSAVKLPVVINGVPVTVGASCGASVYPDEAGDLDSLQALADGRMYDEKRDARLGRSSVSMHIATRPSAREQAASFEAR
ncbi:MAG: diguanylate cyclase [Deltaproteobacteria bacterium]|nr:diguanylate cyclase [Deltaproteobacteria bacterium]